MKLKQVDIFLQPIPLCPFCGYPMLPMNNWVCWYDYDRTLENFKPFRADWHRDLDEEDRLHELFAPRILEVAKKAMEERPRLLLKIKATRTESWVKSHAMKLRKEFSQVSLIGYLIGGGARQYQATKRDIHHQMSGGKH